MKAYIYAKNTESIEIFQNVLDLLEEQCGSEIYMGTEPRRAFYELEKIKNLCDRNDIVVISSTKSLGLNDNNISEQLEWFVSRSVTLVVVDIPATYEFGTSPTTNQAVISALLQVNLNAKNIANKKISNRSNSGRSRIEYPDNWDELYQKWTNKKISSKEFCEAAGLKKATFYNMLTEYKAMLKTNEEFESRYKAI